MAKSSLPEAAASLGTVLLLGYFGLKVVDKISGGGSGGVDTIAQQAGRDFGTTATQAAGGVAQGFHDTTESGFCSAIGLPYDQASGNCLFPKSVGPITPDTPVLGGMLYGNAPVDLGNGCTLESNGNLICGGSF